MKEAKVKSYTRKTKSGKTIQVRAHSRKCKGGSCADKKGAGTELSAIKDKALRDKIIKHVEAVTDGEYSANDYTWKDVLAAARHPGEKSLRASLQKKFGLSVKGVKSKTYNYYNEGKKKPKKSKNKVGERQYATTDYTISYPLLD